MTRRSLRRRAPIVAACVLVLLGSAAAGAAIRASIVTIKPGHFAQLVGTAVYCQNGRTTGPEPRGFLCTLWSGTSTKRPAPGTYGVLVNGAAVTPYRIDARGAMVPVHHYDNPS